MLFRNLSIGLACCSILAACSVDVENAATSESSESAASACQGAEVFDICKYQVGTQWKPKCLGVGTHSLVGSSLDKDISSIKVSPGYQVSLYDSDSASRPFTTLNQSSDLCSTQYNDKARRLVVEKTGSGGSGSGDAGTPPPSTGFKGRIAVSSDGNHHDKDDICATAMTLAVLAQVGLQKALVHYEHSNHLWDNTSQQEKDMIESAEGGASRYGFDKTVFFNGFRDPKGASDHLAQVVNESSATNPLVFILAGPMELPYQGLSKAQRDKLQYVTVVSHSDWNDGHTCAKKDLNEVTRRHCEHAGLHSWFEVVGLPGIKSKHIRDQNPPAWNSPIGDWDWVKGMKNGTWLYERLDKKNGDASDAGMAYNLLTGNENASMADVKRFFGR